MRIALAVMLLPGPACFGAEAPPFPIPSGNYVFRWRDAEFMNGPGFQVTVVIDGRRIVVLNDREKRPGVPLGELARGVAMWHPSFKKWIIGKGEKDKTAPSAGGCSDGPDPYVIDLKTREIWSCEWGP